MKNDNLDKMLNLVDDKYLDEANPENIQVRQRSNKSLKWSTIALCACLVLLVLNVGILIPFLNRSNDDPLIPGPDGEGDVIVEVPGNESLKWEASEPQTSVPSDYDEIKATIDALWELNDLKEEINNEASKDQINDSLEEESQGGSSESSGKQEQGVIEPTTDNQVDGVEEADIIKRTSTHIFYLRGKFLSVYKIDGASTKKVSSYALGGIIQRINEGIKSSYEEDKKEEIIDDSYVSSYNWEMLLVDGGKTINIITQSDAVCPHVTIISLNVENPENISLKRVVTTLGRYETSRVVNNELLLFTTCSSGGFFLPQYNDGNGYKYLPKDKIFVPDSGVYSTNSYMVIQRLDESTLDTNDAVAFYSYGRGEVISYNGDIMEITRVGAADKPIIYVSNENIYITRTYRIITNWGRSVSKDVTEITRISYTGSTFSYAKDGYIVLDGYLNNQYSLDERDGILRVVTTIDERGYDEINEKYVTTVSASIYCVSINEMKTVGKNTNFAPNGERVRSVRFDGDYAYVCTAIVFTDPVFRFNLTYPTNIGYIKTADISGYSTSLIQLGNGYVLGIGYGETSTTLKVEVYKQKEQELISVDSYEVQKVYFPNEYKSYFIDREKGLIGIRVTHYAYSGDEAHRYILLRFDGAKITEQLNTTLTGTRSLTRAVLIGEHLMLFSDTQFKIVSVGFFDDIFTN